MLSGTVVFTGSFLNTFLDSTFHLSSVEGGNYASLFSGSSFIGMLLLGYLARTPKTTREFGLATAADWLLSWVAIVIAWFVGRRDPRGGCYTSAYFDVPGYSLLDRACRLGVPITAIDGPGYGGSTPVAADGSIFLANAGALDHVIAELSEAHGTGVAGVVLIGHCFGAAITMATAARKPTWPLLGIATSGYLLRTPGISPTSTRPYPASPWNRHRIRRRPGWPARAGRCVVTCPRRATPRMNPS